MTQFINTLIFASAMTVAHAQEPDNLREACRLKFAGHYMKVFDSVQRGRQNLLKNQRQIQAINKTISERSQERVKLMKRTEDFDPAAQERLVLVNVGIKQYRETRTDYENLVRLTQTQLSKDQRALQELDKKKQGLFKATRKQNMDTLGYRVEVTYENPCEAFADSCGLSRNDAAKLVNLTKQLPGLVKETCARYANFLGRR